MHELGQYVHGDSPVHRTDPRLKLLAVLALSILTLRLGTTGLIAVTVFLLGISLLAGIAWGMLLGTTRPVWPLFTVLFLIYALFAPGTPILPFASGSIGISYEGLYTGAVQVSRFILLILDASLLTMTTAPSELTMGLEWLLRPLSKVGISSHNIALMVNLALRFFPTLHEEMRNINEAQLARGADFKPGSLRGKIRSMMFIATPLTLTILRRSDELVEAMEARGYQPGPRTYLSELTFTKTDMGALILISLAIIAIWFIG
ncbi:MAG: energy-coupling factor transporter transmembrane component T [Syntrophomonadaceae bacterium]